MAMVKSWSVTPLEWLGLDNLSATVKIKLERDGWSTIDEFVDGYGGATGGGGSTSGGGAGRSDHSRSVPVSVTGDSQDLQGQIDSLLGDLSANVKIGLEKTWAVTPLEWLGLANLSATVSMAMEKSWKVAALEWLGLANLSATVSMAMEKTWKVTALEWLGLANLSAKVSMAMVKSWSVAPLSWLGLANLSATVSMSMSKTWKNSALAWLGLDNLSATVSMSMKKSWKNSALAWLGLDNLSATVSMSMKKSWKNSALAWLGLDDLKSSVEVSPKKGWSGTLKGALGLSDMKVTATVSLKKGSPNKIVVAKNGSTTWQLQLKKLGGVFANGIWRNIAQYANGTTNAQHGSLFLAGESGPEMVGHVGGRTEVLNQSQLAATMYAAVHKAMQGVKINASFYNADAANSESDYETMYRAMYDAFTDAMAGSNERDREKIALMRQIAAKEFTAEVTAASVNRAQTRMNRRAGTTIVPVGT